MKPYQFLLFDADGTLLDFDLCEEKALRVTLEHYNMDGSDETVHAYHEFNAGLWERFNRGEVDRAFLLRDRFQQLIDYLGRDDDPAEVNRYYMEQLSCHADLLEESWEICNRLKEKYQLYIITNGASFTQHGRFAICPLTPLFQKIFISEDMGVQKPHKEYFDAVAADIEGFDPEKALVIGDSLSSDILGANNAGLDCVWYNPAALPLKEGVRCDYEIRRLRQLLAILGEEEKI